MCTLYIPIYLCIYVFLRLLYLLYLLYLSIYFTNPCTFSSSSVVKYPWISLNHWQQKIGAAPASTNLKVSTAFLFPWSSEADGSMPPYVRNTTASYARGGRAHDQHQHHQAQATLVALPVCENLQNNIHMYAYVYVYIYIYGNGSKPCSPVVHIKIARIYGCSSPNNKLYL